MAAWTTFGAASPAFLFCSLFPVFLSPVSAGCQTELVGCYTDFTDGTTRALHDFTEIDMQSFNSLETCASRCAGLRDDGVVGLEFGWQCFCGSGLKAPTPSGVARPVPLSECQKIKCSGNASQWCGDADRLLVFNSTCSKPPPNYHGCIDGAAKALPYCNTKLSHEARAADLLSRLVRSRCLPTFLLSLF